MPWRPALIALATLSVAVAPAVRAQSLSPADRAAALRTIAAAVRDFYVYKDRVPAILARIEQAQAARRYDVVSPVQFAHLVSEDLQAVAHDGHLYLRDDPDQFAAASQSAKDHGTLDAYYRAEAQRSRSGLDHLEILPGNVRYLHIAQFRWDPQSTPQVYAEAAGFLRDGDAVILDLRDNGGGTSDAADLFMKSFLPPDPQHREAPGTGGRDPAWRGKPIYILINAGTGSAAEAVAYGAKAEGAATLVGMTSYGAANNNRYVPVAPRFILSLSEHVPINPITGTNWEGTGVVPDMSISSERALAAAHADALVRLGRRSDATKAQQAIYAWHLVSDRAVIVPPVLAPATIVAHAGCFGPVRLRAGAGSLRFYRDDRPKRPQGVLMRPLDSSGLFGVDGYIDLRVRVTGERIDLLHGSEEARETFARADCPQRASEG